MPIKMARPDVASLMLRPDADPESGYAVRIDGTDTVIGGTSAAAPLYAALNADVNTELGHSAGWLTPKFYQFAKTDPKVSMTSPKETMMDTMPPRVGMHPLVKAQLTELSS